MQVSKVSAYMTFSAYCTCTSYEILTRQKIFFSY